MIDLSLTENFITNIHISYGEVGKQWILDLPQHLQLLSEKLNFELVKPVAELSYNFVALVQLRDNNLLAILKTGPKGALIIPEARWLQYFHHGTPIVYNIEETQNAFLMEHLFPGETLKPMVVSGQDEAATRILSESILALHSEELSASWHLSEHNLPNFKHVKELAPDLSFLKGHLDDNLVSKAISLFHDLSLDCKKDVLLHGDLHHENILHCGSTWKVIDPHGYIGDPASESSAAMYNPLDCFPTYKKLSSIIDSRLNILYEMLPFDPQRIKAWAYCWTLLSAAWDIEGFGKVMSNKIEIAQILNKMKS